MEDFTYLKNEDETKAYEEIDRNWNSILGLEHDMITNRGTITGVRLQVVIDMRLMDIIQILKITGIKLENYAIEYELNQFKKRKEWNVNFVLKEGRIAA